MSIGDVLGVGAAVIVSLGGAGALVVGLSGWLGKIWAERLMERERARHEQDLERLRAQLSQTVTAETARLTTALELQKAKLGGAHSDKLAIYRSVVDIVASTLADFAREGDVALTPAQKQERAIVFYRDRLRAYGYLAMLAPQDVMDAYDNTVDYIGMCIAEEREFEWAELRRRALAMINAIRHDLGIDVTAIAYRGDLQ